MQQSVSVGSLQQLLHLMEDWKTLTLGETSLINLEDWSGLEDIQAKKAHLQELIQESETTWLNAPNVSENQRADGKAQLRHIASELVKLETINRDLLSKHLAKTDQALKASNKTISSLRHIQNAYGKNGPSFWQAYS